MHINGDLHTPSTPPPDPDQDQKPELTPQPEPVTPPSSAPQVNPESAQTSPKAPSHPEVPPHNSPGVVILQWLTYAFWGWLIVALIWLIGVIVATAQGSAGATESIPYAIAASVVLLPLAFVCDLLYRKHEPVKKSGAAMVIMVIHAVLFALLGIGALITTVFLGLSLVINGNSITSGQVTALATTGAGALLYAGAFVRTLNPIKTKKLAMMYSTAMLVVSIGLLALGVVGPLVQSIASRDDRLIEEHLGTVNSAVNQYIADNQKLPTSLNNVALGSQGAQELVDSNRVEYIPGEPVTKPTINGGSNMAYRYKLCVTYKAAAQNSSSYSTQRHNSDAVYSSFVSVYGHGAGRTCYNLQEVVYDNNKYDYNQTDSIY